MEHTSIMSCIEEWETLSDEYITLEKLHKEYCKKLDDLTNLQQKCIKGINHQRYRIGMIKQSLKKLVSSGNHKYANANSPRASRTGLDHRGDLDNRERNDMLQTDLTRRKAQLYEMDNYLPKPNGTYLKIILGNINTSILDKNDRFRYKDEYEKFKLVMSLIALCLSIFNLFTNFRTVDLIHTFLLVWYYCTLTIRESILKVNGSRIKGWWRLHHFISTVLAGVILIWPNGVTYYAFRRQFMAFGAYIGFVQYLQFMYQRGSLYRLKALGQRHNMDVTIEGFNSWMWRGLGFLMPFLFMGYLFELYNAYTLYMLSFAESAEWHVFTLSLLFFILFLGNTLTTIIVIPQKFKEQMKFKYRFTRLDKYIWTHKKRRVSFRNPESPQKHSPVSKKNSFLLDKKDTVFEEEPIIKTVEDQNSDQPNGCSLDVQELNYETFNTKDGILADSDKQTNECDLLQEIEREVFEVSKDIDFDKIDRENEENVDNSEDKKDK